MVGEASLFAKPDLASQFSEKMKILCQPGRCDSDDIGLVKAIRLISLRFVDSQHLDSALPFFLQAVLQSVVFVDAAAALEASGAMLLLRAFRCRGGSRQADRASLAVKLSQIQWAIGVELKRSFPRLRSTKELGMEKWRSGK